MHLSVFKSTHLLIHLYTVAIQHIPKILLKKSLENAQRSKEKDSFDAAVDGPYDVRIKTAVKDVLEAVI